MTDGFVYRTEVRWYNLSKILSSDRSLNLQGWVVTIWAQIWAQYLAMILLPTKTEPTHAYAAN